MRRVASLGVLGALFVLPLYPKVDLITVPGTYIAVRPGDFIVALAVAAWALMLVGERRLPVMPRLIGMLLAIWLLVGFLALLYGGFVMRSISLGTGFAFWAKPLEYFLLGLAVYDLVSVRALTIRHIGIVVASAAAIVIGYALGERFGLLPSPPGRIVPRGLAISTIGDLHQLSAYLGIVAIVAVATWHRLRTRALRLASLAGLVGLVSVMAATGARSEYVALGLCVVLLLVWRPARLPAAWAAALLALFFVLPYAASLMPQSPPGSDGGGGTPSGPSVSDRMFDNSFRNSMEERLGKWRVFIERASTSPIIGLGPSAATVAADGYYVRVLVETGVAGVIVFVGLLGAIGASLWRGARQASGTARALAAGMLVATIFVSLVSVLIDTWVAARVMDLYWPLLGATLAAVALQAAGTGAATQSAGAPAFEASPGG